MEDNIIVTQQSQFDPMQLTEFFRGVKTKWDEHIKEMSNFKDIRNIAEIQNVVYSKRQDACDSILEMDMKIAQYSREYKIKMIERMSYYTSGNIRYSEREAEKRAQNDLYDLMYKINMFESIRGYMSNTLKTLDDIIYGISQRVKIEELVQGVYK